MPMPDFGAQLLVKPAGRNRIVSNRLMSYPNNFIEKQANT
jgi:hypothetical protein